MSGLTTPSKKVDYPTNQSGAFMGLVLNMSWQLALVFLIPVIGGVQLDKAQDTKHVFTFVGLAIALVASILVMRRTVQQANRMPVPKLSAAQKREIQKQYEQDDQEKDR